MKDAFVLGLMVSLPLWCIAAQVADFRDVAVCCHGGEE